ncbi:MAG: hypothetical protein O3B47_05890 [bacterium]|nr:hypothetical protein [bacterium]
MKALYLTLSIIFTVLILILSFGNIAAQCSQLKFLFYDVKQNPTIVFLGVAVVGIITGALYHAFLSKVLAVPEDEEEQNF